MTSDDKNNNTGLAARIKLVIAGLALAGVLAGGAVAAVGTGPVDGDDTTEAALSQTVARGWWGASSRGLSWQ